MGCIVLFLSNMVLVFGEVCAICTHITFSQNNVTVVRQFFDDVSAFVLLGMDGHSFKNILKLESNSKVFHQSIPILLIYLLILYGYLDMQDLLDQKG